jgi:hypothetical protein
LAAGVRSNGDAVVNGGADELIEGVSGLEVEIGLLGVADE